MQSLSARAYKPELRRRHGCDQDDREPGLEQDEEMDADRDRSASTRCAESQAGSG
jgi:hypothetical protein